MKTQTKIITIKLTPATSYVGSLKYVGRDSRIETVKSKAVALVLAVILTIASFYSVSSYASPEFKGSRKIAVVENQ